MLVSMVEEDEPIPILKPLRIVETFLCILSLVFFILYMSMGDIKLSHLLTGLVFGTCITFVIICLVDIIAQVAGEPLPSTPMFLFSLFAVCLFLASAVIGINFYDSDEKYSWALLASAVACLAATVFFAMDAALLCREIKQPVNHEKRPLLQWPKCKGRPRPEEPERKERQSESRIHYAPMPQSQQKAPDSPRGYVGRTKRDEVIQSSARQVHHPAPSRSVSKHDDRTRWYNKPYRDEELMPKLAFRIGHKKKDEMIQTSTSDMPEELVFATPLEAPATSADDDGSEGALLVDDKRVLYRQVSQGHLLQIVNCINVRRLTGNRPGAEYGSDTSAREKTSVATGDSVEITETASKDVSTQFSPQASNSKRIIYCCRGDSARWIDNSVAAKRSAMPSSNNRRNSSANAFRNQEVQVDPYLLGMRVVPVQRRSNTPVALTSTCEVDLVDLPGSVPETNNK